MRKIKKIVAFVRKEAVLCISAFVALLSMFAFPPSLTYVEYIDFKVLCLLFCLMAVVIGFQECGLFTILAQKLLIGKKSFRLLTLLLVLLPFFCSMLITNDVALITFVPFAILILNLAQKAQYIIYIVVLQTISANLGSMATPIGNPQNLFIYSHYNLLATEFFKTIFPLVAISLVGLVIASLAVKGDYVQIDFKSKVKIESPYKLLMFVLIFLLCLLCVFGLINYIALTLITIIALLFASRKVLAKIDYNLLLTFVCFFIFVGNVGQVDFIKELLDNMLKSNTMLSSVVASQFISNVPSAVLLSGFTSNWQELLIGVNIGGLGTPIASLASLISLRIYFNSKKAKPLRFLAVFTIANIIGLAIMLSFSYL